MEFTLHGVHHGLAGLPQRQRLLFGHVGQRDEHRPGAREEGVVHGQGGVGVGGDELGPAGEVLVGRRDLEVVNVEVQAGEDDPHVRVEVRAVGQARKIRLRNVPPEGRVGAANEGNVLGAELGFDSCLTEDEDLVLRGREGEDAADIDGGGVGGAENVIHVAVDAFGLEFLEVLGAGFGGVVGHKDGSFA